MTTINEIMNRCAAELPDGYSIEIGVERGAAWIDLVNVHGESVGEFPVSEEFGFVEGATLNALAEAHRLDAIENAPDKFATN